MKRYADRLLFFLSKVSYGSDGCWYAKPVLRFFGSYFRSKTLSYKLHLGRIKKGLFIRNKCFNTCCINPKHLYLSGSRHSTVKDLIARFWAKVDKHGPDACWPWLASKDVCGYGTIGEGHGLLGNKRSTRILKAHRLSLEIKLGRSLKQGMQALHTCDNPSCVNPEHLFEGTQLTNIKDRDTKGRTAKGIMLPHVLTARAVLRIRRLKYKGFTNKRIGELVSVDRHYVSQIVNRKIWGHI